MKKENRLMSKVYKIPRAEKEAFLKNNIIYELEKELPYEDYPRTMVIEVTSMCNFKCIHCNHKSMTRKKGNMDMRLYKKIIDELALNAPDTEIWPTFYGEPFLLTYKLFYMLDYAKKKGMRNIVINTNGSMLSEEVCEWVIEIGLKRFIISIDGFTKETLEKIRVGGEREQIYNSVNMLLEMKRKKKIKPMGYPIIECQYSMMDENEDEVNDFITYWTERGGLVKTREKLTWCGTINAPNLDKNIERIICPWIFHSACHWNGDLVACACDSEGGFKAGNLKEHAIKELWMGAHRKFRQIHIEKRWNQLPEICKSCLDWQTIGGHSLYNPKEE